MVTGRGAAELTEEVARGRIGTTLRGRYVLSDVIGLGGMAVVYAARHRTGYRVAIKMLRDRLADRPDADRELRREAQLANSIPHPAVVPVIDDDVSDDGYVFLVMPLLEGETVRARWERSGRRLPLSEVLVIADRTLAALESAHAANVVHRDVKPDNVFVTTAGEIRVLDFGIAGPIDANDGVSGAPERAVGSPGFMAPEQALGRSHEVDERTDAWAVGAMMYTLLAGELVHPARTAAEVVARTATVPVPPVRARLVGVPRAVCDVIDRALAFDRDARWRDVAAMRRAIDAASVRALGRSIAELSLDRPAGAAAVPAAPRDGCTATVRLGGVTTRTAITAMRRRARSVRKLGLGAAVCLAAAVVAIAWRNPVLEIGNDVLRVPPRNPNPPRVLSSPCPPGKVAATPSDTSSSSAPPPSAARSPPPPPSSSRRR